jgi:hypothetical protein
MLDAVQAERILKQIEKARSQGNKDPMVYVFDEDAQMTVPIQSITVDIDGDVRIVIGD